MIEQPEAKANGTSSPNRQWHFFFRPPLLDVTIVSAEDILHELKHKL
jgi:hypothetical protein